MLGTCGRIPVLIGWMDFVVELAEAPARASKTLTFQYLPIELRPTTSPCQNLRPNLENSKSRFWVRLGCDALTRSTNSRTSAFTPHYTCHASTTNTFASHSSIWSSPHIYLPTQLCASCRKSWANRHSRRSCKDWCCTDTGSAR